MKNTIKELFKKKHVSQKRKNSKNKYNANLGLLLKNKVLQINTTRKKKKILYKGRKILKVFRNLEKSLKKNSIENFGGEKSLNISELPISKKNLNKKFIFRYFENLRKFSDFKFISGFKDNENVSDYYIDIYKKIVKKFNEENFEKEYFENEKSFFENKINFGNNVKNQNKKKKFKYEKENYYENRNKKKNSFEITKNNFLEIKKSKFKIKKNYLSISIKKLQKGKTDNIEKKNYIIRKKNKTVSNYRIKKKNYSNRNIFLNKKKDNGNFTIKDIKKFQSFFNMIDFGLNKTKYPKKKKTLNKILKFI